MQWICNCGKNSNQGGTADDHDCQGPKVKDEAQAQQAAQP